MNKLDKKRDYIKSLAILGIAGSLFYLAGKGIVLGVTTLDRNARQSTINDLYKTAQDSRTMYFNGNPDSATRNHQEMWNGINQYQRNTLKDPWGRLTSEDMSRLETNLNSTNVFSNGPLVKPVVK